MRLLSTSLLRSVSLLALVSSVSAGGVVKVGESGSVSYPTLQVAIDAASEGDTLLVAQGTYPGFTIQDRSISIFAAPGGQVVIEGQVRVTGLAAQRSVLIAGLEIRPPEDPAGLVSVSALELVDDDGHVRIESCTLVGAQPTGEAANGTGGTGALVVNCDRVVLASSSVHGGAGRSFCPGPLGCDLSSAGGLGLWVRNSVVAVFECDVRGGYGGFYDVCTGPGGTAMLVFASNVWLAGSSVTGGAGGITTAGCTGFLGGNGGDGLLLQSGTIQSLDNSLAGGPGGATSTPGQPGVPLVNNGGTYNALAGRARLADAELVLEDTTSNALSLAGEPGDKVWVASAARPSFQLAPFLSGWWLVPLPARLPMAPLGTIAGTGTLSTALPTPSVTASSAARLGWHQVYAIDAVDSAWIAAPFHQLVLNRDGQPDCDGNGVLDYLDALEDPSRDCNGNLLIDACELAAGAVPDCNSNFVPDSCDIASGSSTDLNADGIPDECQPAITLWVDVAAAPGGNGSAGAPFQSLSEALAAAAPQHLLVLVRDGTYTGPLNRDLDFGGKSLLVKSVNGTAACTFDLAGAGRLASLHAGEVEPAGFRGFTITGGSAPRGGALLVESATASLTDCRIEGCAADDSAGGGAVYLSQGTLTLRGCELIGNSADFGRGGALSIGLGATLEVIDSTFAGNVAREGGALAIEDSVLTTVSHCRFLANSAVAGQGGAVRSVRLTGPGAATQFRAADCLFAGNVAAGRGGACAFVGVVFGGGATQAMFIESTLTANESATQGGALYLGDDMASTVLNSVLWGNQAPLGPQIAMTTKFALGSGLTVQASDLQGGKPGVYNPGGNFLGGSQEISVDPQFLDPDGPDNDPSTFADNDYSLAALSPCIDRGDNVFGGIFTSRDWFDLDGDGDVFEPIPYDLAWNTRRVEDPAVPNLGVGTPPLIDMGCFEHQP
jgi:hypothetical protein